MQENKTIAFVAGRSGGHVIPCATIAQKYKNIGFKTVFFATNTKLDKQILDAYSYLDKIYYLDLDNIPRKKLHKIPSFIYQLISSFLKSIKFLKATKPSQIISSGGYIALPVCLAAKLLKIPVDFYELNVKPGAAIKFLSPIARTNYICFEKTAQYLKKTKLTQYPIKFNKQSKIDTKTAKIQLDLDPNKKTILILGGSQGSSFINKLILDWLKINNNSEIQVIHQTGKADIELLLQEYSNLQIPAKVFDYSPDINLSYCAADFIIARAGAGTLFEILFFNKKALIIPLETKNNNHQLDNALEIAQKYPEQFTVLKQIHAKPEDIQKFIII